MPGLNTKLHLRMHRKSPMRKRGRIYGLEWGDPEKSPYLAMVRRHYIDFFVNPSATLLEIGPGGGRWTRFMVEASKIYAVDRHQELLDELRANCPQPNIVTIRNNGDDFPGVPDASIDFLFSFGVFVHLELDIIGRYLINMRRLLKPTSNVVIHYSDMTKPAAQRNATFAQNNPEAMIGLVRKHGYTVQDDNRWIVPNGAIVRFTL